MILAIGFTLCTVFAILFLRLRRSSKVRNTHSRSDLPASLVGFSKLVEARMGMPIAFRHLENAEPLRRFEIIESLLKSDPDFSEVDADEVCSYLSTEQGFEKFAAALDCKIERGTAAPQLLPVLPLQATVVPPAVNESQSRDLAS